MQAGSDFDLDAHSGIGKACGDHHGGGTNVTKAVANFGMRMRPPFKSLAVNCEDQVEECFASTFRWWKSRLGNLWKSASNETRRLPAEIANAAR